MSNHYARINMIKQQLRTGDVLNDSILDLYEQVSRADFVPDAFTDFAFSDMQIPLEHGQCMLTPLEEGKILQALKLKGNETILEIGTGSGFFTALLSKLTKKVYSVDLYADFTQTAEKKLRKYNCKNVELITGDGCRGWLEKAPYDIVIFTGGLESITDTQRLQVLPGGSLFAIIGKTPVMQGRLYNLTHEAVWQESILFETDIPALVDQLKPKEFVF